MEAPSPRAKGLPSMHTGCTARCAALVVVVMVLPVCPEDPLASRWGFGVGHCLQPVGPYGMVGSWGGLGAGLNGDRGREVPSPRVGLAGGGGGFGGGG